MSDSPDVMLKYYNNEKREKILSMIAGRELDRLVGKMVIETNYPENYSTDISDAWGLLDKISEKGLVWRIEGLTVTIFNPFAGSPADDGTMIFVEVIGNTTDEAICKAALLVVMKL